MSHIAREDIAEIVRLGTLRAPSEACGLLLTRHDAGPRIAEVPNRAQEPSHDVLMLNGDIQMALAELVVAGYDGDLAGDLVLWHTHPSGNVGPSRTDMQMKRSLPGEVRCLVVALPGGEASQF